MIKRNTTNSHLLEKNHIEGEPSSINVNSIQSVLDQEVIDRISDVDQEESDRVTAVGIVQGDVDQEVIDRANGDIALDANLITIDNRMDNTIPKDSFEWRSVGTINNGGIFDIKYVHNIFIVVGHNLTTSYDCISWVERISTAGPSFLSIGYTPTRIFAGTNQTSGGNRLYYSDDNGINWSYFSGGSTPGYTTDMLYTPFGGGRLIAVRGYSGNGIKYSTDNGSNWTSVTNPIADGIYSIAFSATLGTGSGRLVIVGEDGKMAYSDNSGDTWTLINAGSGGTEISNTSQITSIVFAENLTKFVAVSKKDSSETYSNITHSSDGINWTSSISPFLDDNIYSISYSERFNIFVTSSSNIRKTIISYDGETWNELSTFDDLAGPIIAIAYSPTLDKFVACGSGGYPNGVISHIGLFETSLKGPLRSPGLAPMYASRTWVNFSNISGVGLVINNSRNVSSVVVDAVGKYTINFLIPMPDENYSVSGICGDINVSTIELNVDYVKIQTRDYAGTWQSYKNNICITIVR